jgi:class 3 adenylate cyclase
MAFYGDSETYLDEIERFLTGARAAPSVNRVLATVLFTDIVGSTQRAAELGDTAWQRLLGRHDDLVRTELERYRGQEVKQTGDGFLATFDGPARAIRCAQAIVDAVQTLGLDVRAGLHAGECELRDADIGGMAVHIGSRVCALAGPGEVLVSSTVEDLVVGSGIHFSAHGTQELKGVPGSWRLRAVARDDEPTGASKTAATDDRPHKVMDRIALRTLRRAPRLSRRTMRRVLGE